MKHLQHRQKKIASTHKFMQVIANSLWNQFGVYAKQRSITIQELLRAVVLPEWIAEQERKARLKRQIERLDRQAAKRDRLDRQAARRGRGNWNPNRRLR